MGAKPRDIGGGAATPVAGAFNDFLMQQLTGQNAQQPRQVPDFIQRLNPDLASRMRQQNSNAQQPQQQQTGFQNAFNSMLSGNINDQSGAGAALQNYFQNGSNNLPTNFGNTFQAPEYSAAQLSQLPTNFGAGQTGMANLSGFGNAAQSGFNTQAPINSQFTGALQGMMGQGMNQLSQGNGGFAAAQNGAAVQMTPQMSYQDALADVNNDPKAALALERARADQRARFGAEGAGALGTGAQFAEATLNADFLANTASNNRALALQRMNQDLQGNQALANVGLQNRGQDMQTAIANMQGGLQGAQNQTALLNQLLGAAGSARGQDMQTMLGQLGLGSQQDMFNAGQQNDMQSQMLQGTLQNQQMGNQFGLGAAGLNNQAMQSNNANALNNSQFQNTFNQNNAQLGAQFGLGANQLNSGNAAQNQQLFQQMINSGLNLNQLGNTNQQNMLAQLFGGFGQSNQLGTSQRQTVMQPSAFGQIANAGLGLAGAYLTGGGSLGGMMGGLGGLFGGGGGGSAALPVGIGGGALPQSMGNFRLGGG